MARRLGVAVTLALLLAGCATDTMSAADPSSAPARASDRPPEAGGGGSY
jgi:hypothetical protein